MKPGASRIRLLPEDAPHDRTCADDDLQLDADCARFWPRCRRESPPVLPQERQASLHDAHVSRSAANGKASHPSRKSAPACRQAPVRFILQSFNRKPGSSSKLKLPASLCAADCGPLPHLLSPQPSKARSSLSSRLTMSCFRDGICFSRSRPVAFSTRGESMKGNCGWLYCRLSACAGR